MLKVVVAVNFQYRYLDDNVDQDDQEGVGEVEEKPDLYRLDVKGAGQAAGDWEVDRGQHHHAGHIDSDDKLVLNIVRVSDW